MRTVGSHGTFSIGSFVNSRSALHFAFRLVGIPIGSTDWRVVGTITVSLAVVGGDASSKVSFFDSFASHETLVIVGNSVCSTYWDEGFCLGTAAIAEVSSLRKSKRRD